MPAALQVLIATCRPEGISRVRDMNLPEVDGVEYLVMWQLHADALVPEALAARVDVTVMRSERVGLSANRNDLFDAATSPVVLIADDDLIYTPESLKALLETVKVNPDVDYFSFKHDEPRYKFFPEEECSLNKPVKYFYQTSFEIALRRNARTAALRFHEDFGIGAPYFGAGEEELLLMTARRMGLNCRFFPICIVTHPGLSTGNRKPTAKTLHARGAIVALSHRWTWILRLPVHAWRLRSVSALGPLFAGALSVAFRRKTSGTKHKKLT